MKIRKNKANNWRPAVKALAVTALCAIPFWGAHARVSPTIDYPIVKLRSLDKITARTMTFEAAVGTTVKFGSVYIKVRACRKTPEMEEPEAAAFLQVWEAGPVDKPGDAMSAAQEEQASDPEWVFSGWMFSSSPGLSAMDHPIYDVWVLDCMERQGPKTNQENAPKPEDTDEAQASQPSEETGE
ncbi:MAG: DUF2155 domain-containing protein [Alphaproteobacteria bacterium]|nr:DUF2155 domain-containing protein [Alphaproteobacteria bacterium]